MSLHYEWTLSLRLRSDVPEAFLEELRYHLGLSSLAGWSLTEGWIGYAREELGLDPWLNFVADVDLSHRPIIQRRITSSGSGIHRCSPAESEGARFDFADELADRHLRQGVRPSVARDVDQCHRCQRVAAIDDKRFTAAVGAKDDDSWVKLRSQLPRIDHFL
jgi:hypothetical protein